MATGGYRSFETFWLGGSSAVPVTIVGGYRSPEAPWLGGASAPAVVPPTTTGGYRSFESLWIGGSSGFTGTPPPPTPTSGGGTKLVHPVKANAFRYPGESVQYTQAMRDRILQDDDDLILIWSIVLKNQE